MGIGRNHQGHALDHLNADFIQRSALTRVVGEQPDPGDLQPAQDLASGDVAAFLRFKAKMDVGIDRVQASILQGIGAELVDQPDASAFLGQINHDPGSFGGHGANGTAQLVATITAQAADQVAGKAGGMDACQHRLRYVQYPDHDRQGLGAAVPGTERHDLGVFGIVERQPRRRHFGEPAGGILGEVRHRIEPQWHLLGPTSPHRGDQEHRHQCRELGKVKGRCDHRNGMACRTRIQQRLGVPSDRIGQGLDLIKCGLRLQEGTEHLPIRPQAQGIRPRQRHHKRESAGGGRTQ